MCSGKILNDQVSNQCVVVRFCCFFVGIYMLACIKVLYNVCNKMINDV